MTKNNFGSRGHLFNFCPPDFPTAVSDVGIRIFKVASVSCCFTADMFGLYGTIFCDVLCVGFLILLFRLFGRFLFRLFGRCLQVGKGRR